MSASEAFAPVIARMAELYAEHRAAADVAFGPAADEDATVAAWERLERVSENLDALTEDAAAGIAELVNALDDGRGDQNATMHLAKILAGRLDSVHLGTTVHAYLEALDADDLARALSMGATALAFRTGPETNEPEALNDIARRSVARASRYLAEVSANQSAEPEERR